MNAFQPLTGYRSKKAAQVAAIFLRAARGKMDKLKLIKLMYLTERESIRTRGRPMLYDELYSLKDGPICSSTLNALNGGLDNKTWGQYIEKDGTKDIYLVKSIEIDFDEVSTSDQRVIDSVVKQFLWMNTSQVRNWTHDPRNCPEYTEVENNGRLPISYSAVASAVGVENPIEVERSIKEYRDLQAFIDQK